MNWKFWKQKPQLRIQLRIGGLLYWDITEQELRDAVLWSGGSITHTCVTPQAQNSTSQLIEFTVTQFRRFDLK